MSDAKNKMEKSVAIFIFNTKRELLLQRRAADDDSYPLCLDFSAAGGIERDESKDTASVRELREELGIETPLQYIGTYVYTAPPSGEILEIFRGVYEGPFHPNPTEVQEVVFCSIDEISRKIESGDQFHPEFLSVFGDPDLLSRIVHSK